MFNNCRVVADTNTKVSAWRAKLILEDRGEYIRPRSAYEQLFQQHHHSQGLG
jgi:hypothetical protein